MPYLLGIDLGTTFTAAAVLRTRDGEAVGEPEMVGLGSHGSEMPSVVLDGEDGSLLVGEAAERRAMVEPDRVAREFKRRIGDPTPVSLGTGALPRRRARRGDRAARRRDGRDPGGRAARADRADPPGVLGRAQAGAAALRRSTRPWPVSVRRRSSSWRSRRPRPSATPPPNASNPAPRSPSTTSAAARSTPPSCARTPQARSPCSAAPKASSSSAASTSTRSCSSTSAPAPPTRSPDSTKPTPPSGPPSPACAANAARPRKASPPTPRSPSPSGSAAPRPWSGCTAASSRN